MARGWALVPARRRALSVEEMTMGDGVEFRFTPAAMGRAAEQGAEVKRAEGYQPAGRPLGHDGDGQISVSRVCPDTPQGVSRFDPRMRPDHEGFLVGCSMMDRMTKPRKRPWLSGAALVAGALAMSPPAAANPAAAEALFREGRKLMQEGQLDQACGKLAESQRLDASPGTLGSLAQCHEKQGKIATAWAEYLASSRLGAAQGKQAQAQAAKERAAALEGRLIYLTVKVPSPVPGLVVKRDDQLLEASSFNTRLPVDPGPSVLRAEAPGFEPYSKKLSLVEGEADNVVTIPALSKLEPGASPSATVAPLPPGSASAATGAPTAPATAPQRSSPVAGYVVGGAGVVALGVGVFFGLRSLSDYHAAEQACGSHAHCSKDAVSFSDSAHSKAWVSNIGVGLGLVGVALGGYLVFSSSNKPSETAVRLGGRVAQDGATLQLAGGF